MFGFYRIRRDKIVKLILKYDVGFDYICLCPVVFLSKLFRHSFIYARTIHKYMCIVRIFRAGT